MPANRRPLLSAHRASASGRKKKYQPSAIETAWQKHWRESSSYQAKDFDRRPKYYVLVEFPYPSGEGLHVGHSLSYIAQDIIARWKRMQGYNVLYPIGWDAFGLPTENFAISHNVDPRQATKKNIANFKRQIQSLGISFDWSREINTSDPAYYKWTQWIFLQFFKRGLAVKREVPINWCPKDKIGLAFEEVIEGKCERCGTPTERRLIKQWVLLITAYADRLLKDLETVDYLPSIKQQQINWIGQSQGAEIVFRIRNTELSVEVFTTRPDTTFGATYLVLSPEHELLKNKELGLKNRAEVERYVALALSKTERQRQEGHEKTGVELKGVLALNPATTEEIPVWVADYVLSGYGTGAIMAVPAHDVRDNEFAKKYDLPIVEVLDGQRQPDGLAYDGRLVNSGVFNGRQAHEARQAITDHVGGKMTVRYKLRDWIFSRQRYWGEPIPIIICDHCGYVPVAEKDLPLLLPPVKKYQPTDTGESPLATIKKWVEVPCPLCGRDSRRETDTMPNWAGSSWYFLRYIDPQNDRAVADIKKLRHWLPVDLYNGGMEHTTLHLLYSRFWHKFLYDLKLVPTSEPYQRRVSHGMILGPDNQKMSKSRGNVISPDAIVKKYGADTLRLYEMFMGDYAEVKAWSDSSLQGVHRFLNRLWNYFQNIEIVEEATPRQLSSLHQTIKQVSDHLERRSFNTAVSTLMIGLNQFEKESEIARSVAEDFIRLLAPFVPHIAEEIWSNVISREDSVHETPWPKAKEEYIVSLGVTLGVQINGKVRSEFTVTPDMSEADIREAVLQQPNVARYLAGRTIKKFIYVKNKIISIVI